LFVYVAIGIIIVISTIFVLNIFKFINRFENSVVSDKNESVIKSKYLIAFNLRNNSTDTLYFKGIKEINFWAYYCTPCKLEMPLLDSMNKFYEVILLTNDSSNFTKEFIKENIKDLGVYYCRDTTAFGYSELIPRTIVLKDSTVKIDNTGKLTINAIDLRAKIDFLCKD
jgi:thiol-disulfide isomerase/thioredoxin